jgi:hypothetical protein
VTEVEVGERMFAAGAPPPAVEEPVPATPAPSFGRVQSSGLVTAFFVPQLAWLLLLAYVIHEAF